MRNKHREQQNKEKQNYNKNTMSLIRTGKGDLTSNPKQILQEQCKFYQKLYAKNSNVVFELKNTNGEIISDDQKVELDKPLTILELTQTVRTLKKRSLSRN